MIAVIMAGGKGKRIRNISEELPKPMIPVLQKPILEYQVENLKGQGIREFYFMIGYKGEKIKEHFGDGSNWNVNIKYITEKSSLGTAGALWYLRNRIKEDFILLNGDIIFDIDISKFYAFHKSQNGIGTLLVHPNSHPQDSTLVVSDQNNKIVNWIHKEGRTGDFSNRVNAGIHLFKPSIFRYFVVLEKRDLDRDILKSILQTESLYAYTSPEYVKDMGTPERFHQVEKDIGLGRVSNKNLKYKQKAIFLDRDGTINVYKGFITNKEQIELLEGVAEKIRDWNQTGYLVIVITNQPVIARGECSIENLKQIHNRIETLLGEKGAYLDDIFYCPHHPDKGYEGECLEYKINCKCRKPQPGMLIEAANKYNIDLSKSYMIGDTIQDLEAGKKAGCKSIMIEKWENFSLI